MYIFLTDHQGSSEGVAWTTGSKSGSLWSSQSWINVASFYHLCDQESIIVLQSVQRHFLSQVTRNEVSSLDHQARVKQLKVYSQECNREDTCLFCLEDLPGLVQVYHVDYTSDSFRDKAELTFIEMQFSHSLLL